MYCQNCGNQIPDNARFCPRCGTDLYAGRSGAAPAPEPWRAVPAPEPARRSAAQPAWSADAGGATMLAEMRRKSLRTGALSLGLALVIPLLLLIAGEPMAGLCVGVVLIPIGGFPLIKALRGGYQKQIRDFIAANGCAREAERFYYNTTPVWREVRLGRDFVYFRAGSKDILLRPWDVAWAYRHVYTQYVLIVIPIARSYSVVVRTMGGKTYSLTANKKIANELLEAMQRVLPGTLFGYDSNLEKVYKENRQAFAARWEEKVPGCMTGHTPM